MLVRKDSTGINFIVVMSSDERADILQLGTRNGLMSDEVVAMAIEVGITYMKCVECEIEAHGVKQHKGAGAFRDLVKDLLGLQVKGVAA